MTPQPLRGITVCRTHPDDKRDEPARWSYDDIMCVTLPLNMRHFIECIVVTAPDDERTKAVCREVPGVRVFETDAFTRYGARFNKGLAMEEGFDALGRHGWILIWDADILLPDYFPWPRVREGCVHGARRRVLEDPARWTPDLDWATAGDLTPDGMCIGFFQLFNGDDPAVRAKRPWYEVTFAHAGGCDAYFLTHWPHDRKRSLDYEVLHLGPVDTHWFGTDPAARRIMDAYVMRNGWTRRRWNTLDRPAAEQVETIVERIRVPGYADTGYELPFVRRTKARNERD